MAISSLRSRRIAARQTQTTRQLIAFRLRQEWFALPIQAVRRVVPLETVDGDPVQTSITTDQGQEISMINVESIFPGAPEASGKSCDPSYIAIIQSNDSRLVGLLIDSPPSLRRVPESAVTPLSEGYLARGNLQCVSSLVTSVDNQPLLFLLDSEQLVRTMDSKQ